MSCFNHSIILSLLKHQFLCIEIFTICLNVELVNTSSFISFKRLVWDNLDLSTVDLSTIKLLSTYNSKKIVLGVRFDVV